MDASKLNQLREELLQQISFNFNEQEIIQNLEFKGYTIEEIEFAKKQCNISMSQSASAKEGGSGFSVISIIISIVFIIRGMIYLGQNNGFGWFFYWLAV